MAEEMDERVTKRRRFHASNEIDSLSEDFSSHSLLYKSLAPPNMSIFAASGGKGRLWDLMRPRSATLCCAYVSEGCRMTVGNNTAYLV